MVGQFAGRARRPSSSTYAVGTGRPSGTTGTVTKGLGRADTGLSPAGPPSQQGRDRDASGRAALRRRGAGWWSRHPGVNSEDRNRRESGEQGCWDAQASSVSLAVPLPHGSASSSHHQARRAASRRGVGRGAHTPALLLPHKPLLPRTDGSEPATRRHMGARARDGGRDGLPRARWLTPHLHFWVGRYGTPRSSHFSPRFARRTQTVW